MVFHGHAGFTVVKKLQGLKAKIKAWNKDTYGKSDILRSSLKREIEEWDKLEKERSLNQVESVSR